MKEMSDKWNPILTHFQITTDLWIQVSSFLEKNEKQLKRGVNIKELMK
jgi:hypothetical protein